MPLLHFMNNILLLDDHEKTRRLYSANLEVYTGANVIEFGEIDQAIEYLDDEIPQIIIVRSKVQQRNAAEKISQILKDHSEKVLLIIIGESSISGYDAKIFQTPVDIKALVQVCAVELKVTANLMFSTDVSAFYPIPIYLLLPGLQLVCPIFKRAPDGSHKELLTKNHRVHQEVLVMLKDDNIDTVYVNSKDRLKFVSSLTVQTTEFLRNDRISIKDKMTSVEQGHKMVREMAKKMMIDTETVQLAEASIDTMVSIVDHVKTLKSMLALTLSNDMGFMYRHCLLTSYIGCHIINNMEWGTQDQQTKICFVSFFHDISLQDEELLKIHTDEELMHANLSESDHKKVDQHAIRSATFLSKYYSSIPLGADVIVKQHHGSRNGIGLSNLSQNISPLSIVFIVAEEWALFALRNEEKKENQGRKKVLSYIYRKYNLPAFKKVLSVLDKLSF